MAAEPTNEQLTALYHEFGHDVPGFVSGELLGGLHSLQAMRVRAIIAAMSSALLAARETIAERDLQIAALHQEIAALQEIESALEQQRDSLRWELEAARRHEGEKAEEKADWFRKGTEALSRADVLCNEILESLNPEDKAKEARDGE